MSALGAQLRHPILEGRNTDARHIARGRSSGPDPTNASAATTVATTTAAASAASTAAATTAVSTAWKRRRRRRRRYTASNAITTAAASTTWKRRRRSLYTAASAITNANTRRRHFVTHVCIVVACDRIECRVRHGLLEAVHRQKGGHQRELRA